MTLNERKLNEQIMCEIGFEAGPKMRVIDQETGIIMKYKGKELVIPGGLPNKDVVIFDPYNNTGLMRYIFGIFALKYFQDTGISLDYTYIIDGEGMNGILCIKDSNQHIINSSPYKRDTLRYIDIIMRLNGDTNPFTILSSYDVPRR